MTISVIFNSVTMITLVLFSLFLCHEITASQNDACDGTPMYLTGSRGSIYSPGYLTNEPYPDGVKCIWKIVSYEGYRIHLKFNDLDLDEVSQCTGDALVVYNANHGSFVNIFCGKQKPNDLISKTNRLEIHFRSDYLYSGRGFNLSYSFTARQSHCQSNEIECLNRKCILRNTVCDGVDNCGDHSDERFCKSRKLSPPKYECGSPAVTPVLAAFSKVVGGQIAVEGSWPWQMDIQLDFVEPNGHICGGALIAPQYALTAAHCLDSNRHPSNFRLVFGNHRRFRPTGHEQVRYIDRYVIYPNILDKTYYENPGLQFDMDHDIALIRLSSPVTLTERVQPICLPPSQSEVTKNTECYSTGWGKTQGTGGSDVLKQLQLFIDSGKACEAKGSYNDSRICVVSRGHNTGLCSGDSGGPLVCKSNNKWYLRGITSHLTKGSLRGPVCGIQNEGMTFAKVSEKIEWINQLIRLFEKHSNN